MPVSFTSLTALEVLEVLDSRGSPSVSVTAKLSDGSSVRAGVPSGASTGSREAVELRDHDEARFAGSGVLRDAGKAYD